MARTDGRVAKLSKRPIIHSIVRKMQAVDVSQLAQGALLLSIPGDGLVGQGNASEHSINPTTILDIVHRKILKLGQLSQQ